MLGEVGAKWRVKSRSVEAAPRSYDELQSCIVLKKCTTEKGGSFGHVLCGAGVIILVVYGRDMVFYPQHDDYGADTVHSREEPRAVVLIAGIHIRYLVLKYADALPLYDERFVNYGFNKIQYWDRLRYYRGIHFPK